MHQTFCYIHVSSVGQNEARQKLALEAFGVQAVNIFMDKQSGKDFKRLAYKRLLKMLNPGDLLCRKTSLKTGGSGKLGKYQA